MTLKQSHPPALTLPLHDRRVWLLMPILLLAAVLRIHGLNYHSYWFDETWTVMSANGTLPEYFRVSPNHIYHPQPALFPPPPRASWWAAWNTLDGDIHPPLYPIVYRLWTSAFGDTDYAGRSLSVFASLAAIVMVFDVARQLQYGTAAALCAALLMAVAQPQIDFSQEARSYMLLIALSLGAADALLRIERHGPRWWRAVAMGLCVGAMGLTHYAAISVVAALGLYSLLVHRGHTRRRILGTMLFAGAIDIRIWWSSLVFQIQRYSLMTAWMKENMPDHLEQTVQRLLRIPGRFLMDPAQWLTVPVGVAGVILLLSGLLAGRKALLPALWLIMAIGIVAANDFFRSTYQLEVIRYTVLATPAFYLLVAATLGDGNAHPPAVKRLRWMPIGLALSLCMLGFWPLASNGSLPIHATSGKIGERWRSMARELDRIADSGDVILFAPTDQDTTLASPLQRYLPVLRYLHKPHSVVFLESTPQAPLAAQLHAAQRIWLVSAQQDSSRNNSVFRLIPHCHLEDALTIDPITGTIFRLFPDRIDQKPTQP